MATSTTGVFTPLEEYLRTSYEHDREWVDGEVRERSMPDLDHATLQAFFAAYFGIIRRELHVKVATELRLHVSAFRYRIPDVTLISEDAPKQQVPDIAPVLCIEIVSKDDKVWELQEKLDDYVAMGVGAIWVVTPTSRKLSIVDAAGRTVPVVRFEVPGSDRVIEAAEIFAELD